MSRSETIAVFRIYNRVTGKYFSNHRGKTIWARQGNAMLAARLHLPTTQWPQYVVQKFALGAPDPVEREVQR